MLGDLIIFIKDKIKRNITCRHNYVIRNLSGIKDYQYCTKCGRVKKGF